MLERAEELGYIIYFEPKWYYNQNTPKDKGNDTESESTDILS
jgi:hypothetical protein